MIKFKSIIIGCGKIAGLYDDIEDTYVYSHAKAYNNHSKIDLIACYDLDIENAKLLANKHNIANVSDDYIKIIKDYFPDIVSVSTPDNTHFDIAMSILNSDNLPKIIFLEKPACQNEEELNLLISLSNEKNVKIVVNHSRRFDSLYKELKTKIQSNEFGQLVKADVIYYSGWQHNGVHIVDTLNYLFSDTLQIEKLLNFSLSPYDNDFNIDFKCKFKKNNALVYITTMDEKYYQLFEFDFKFENARIRLEDFGQRLSYEKKEINGMNERVLIKEEYKMSLGEISPMQSAINTMVDYLEYNISLEGYLVDNISQTMKTIWKGTKWIK